MDKKKLQRGAWAAGGAALLAAVSVLCVKGMKAVDKHMKAKREDVPEEAELFEETVETTEDMVPESALAEETVAEAMEETNE